MTKAILVIGSFFAGFVCAFLLIDLPSVSAQGGDNGRSVFIGGGARGFGPVGGLVKIAGVTPLFAPLEKTPIFKGFEFVNGRQSLDGLDCRGCTFTDVELRYGGGAYHLEGSKFSGTTRLVYEGAAANTLAFVQFMQGIAKGMPGVALPQNKPVIRRTTAKNPGITVDTTAPFIGK